MKNKQLKNTGQVVQKQDGFRPKDCLNYVKANRRVLLKKLFRVEDIWRESQDIEDDLRERYRI